MAKHMSIMFAELAIFTENSEHDTDFDDICAEYNNCDVNEWELSCTQCIYETTPDFDDIFHIDFSIAEWTGDSVVAIKRHYPNGKKVVDIMTSSPTHENIVAFISSCLAPAKPA